MERFTVKQSHLKKAPKTIDISIGSMGLQQFGAKGKPLESYLYENMKAWDIENDGFSIRVGADERKIVYGTNDGAEILRRIATAAREIGQQYLIDKQNTPKKGQQQQPPHGGFVRASAGGAAPDWQAARQAGFRPSQETTHGMTTEELRAKLADAGVGIRPANAAAFSGGVVGQLW